MGMNKQQELKVDLQDGAHGNLDSWEEPKVFARALKRIEELEAVLMEIEKPYLQQQWQDTDTRLELARVREIARKARVGDD